MRQVLLRFNGAFHAQHLSGARYRVRFVLKRSSFIWCAHMQRACANVYQNRARPPCNCELSAALKQRRASHALAPGCTPP